MKRLKTNLKNWNKETFGLLDKRIETRKLEILKLDVLDDAFGLDEWEVAARNKERALLITDIKQKDSLLRQKAIVRWIKEEDTNSSLFHKCINKRRKSNEIVGLNINGVWTEEVSEVKNGVFEFFKSHFSENL